MQWRQKNLEISIVWINNLYPFLKFIPHKDHKRIIGEPSVWFFMMHTIAMKMIKANKSNEQIAINAISQPGSPEVFTRNLKND